MKTIDLIAGARPNFMKIAPIIDALNARKAEGGPLRYRLIHTGQHYDHAMSGGFFEQLGIPAPDIHLEVGSGSQATQTGAIMLGYEKVLAAETSDLCLVVGDVTSTMACAVVARKMGVPVAHVEAGIRSGDWSMPEEINRVVTDSVTNWFFTTSQTANENLKNCGVDDSSIIFVGNVMIDTLLKHRSSFRPASIFNDLQLQSQGYLVLTLHRPANVDETAKLETCIETICSGANDIPVIFPVHPRTEEQLRKISEQFPNLHCTKPLGYLEFNHLVENSLGVITDSGGVTEETTVMGVPCMTLRDNTERPETVTTGTNVLVGTDPERIPAHLKELLEGHWKAGGIPELWDGKSAHRIVEHLERLMA